jgi:hypothetical protein
MEDGETFQTWIDKYDDVVAIETWHANGEKRERRKKSRTKGCSEDTFGKAARELQDEGKQATESIDYKGNEHDPNILVAMPQLKIVKTLEKKAMDLLVAVWCLKVWNEIERL